ncbi:hypothetical protein ScPMuIL_002649 [Solemya velum]
MHKLSGQVKIKGDLAYVPQQAWIQNLTVRDNILYGSDFVDEVYHQVVKSCALLPDLELWEAQDQTEIGEKGINISGGQKQRVSLARAVYSDADVYLMDDPLSAVDSHVGKDLFKNVIGNEGLLKNKTRILVTHGVHWLPMVDKIVVLTNGQISEVGSYDELLDHNGEFAQFLKEYLIKGDHTDSHDPESECSMTRNNLAGSSQKNNSAILLLRVHNDKSTPSTQKSGQLIQKEALKTGMVKMGVYLAFVRAVGVLPSCPCLPVCTDIQWPQFVIPILADIWTEDSYLKNMTLTNTTTYHDKYTMYLGVFTALVVVKKLTNVFRMMIMMLFRLIQIVVIISITTPLFLAALFPVAIIYLLILRLYLPTAHQVKRLESVTRSPVFNHFSETISGASVIRSFQSVNRFNEELSKRVDMNCKCLFASITGTRWIAIQLQFLGIVVIFLACVFAIESSTLNASEVGLSITNALQITIAMNNLVQSFSDLDMHIVSVERVKEYTELQPEAEWNIPSMCLRENWPRKADITYQKYITRYRPGLDLVLKGISFQVNDREKIGIVGRTGAGKSSLTLSLFRLIEAVGGQILIDGVDIAEIGLHELRSKITILPQEPVIFCGSLRRNLDPFGRYDDSDIWQSLECAHIRQFVTEQSEQLEFECGEAGKNLSVGQRQLVCLARALLHKTRILVLDEATAAVDMETDDLIQQTIHREFSDCTILTIAHRLKTVMDYDRIMVLDKGCVVEFDTPQALLAINDGVFYSMAKNANLM